MTFIIAVAASTLILIAGVAGLAMLALSGEKPHGSHARGAGTRHAAPSQDEADPFTDPDEADPDKSADEFIAALHDDGEPEPVLAAPVAAPPLDRREVSAMPARAAAGMMLPAWEPPMGRGALESLRDALRAWTPAPAVPQEPEAEPEPEPVCDPHGENTQQIFQRLVGGSWNVAAMTDEIERSVYGGVAPKGSDFAGTSLTGLPDEDWPVLAGTADGVRRGGDEAGAR